jgi:hypothetical protein
MDGSIKIVQQLKQAFESHHKLFKELKKRKKEAPHHNVSAKKIRTQKIVKQSFRGVCHLFGGFRFSREALNET